MLQMCGDDARNADALKWVPQGQCTVKNTAQRVEIGAVVDRLAIELFGRQEVNRAGQCTRVVQRLLGWSRHDLRKAEVQKLDPCVATLGPSDHDICRFDVAMHHAQRVGRTERIQTLACKFPKHPHLHRLGQAVQTFTIDEFHDHKHVFVGWQEIKDRYDIRMLQAGEALGFVEGSCGIRERLCSSVHAFDRDMTIQKLVVGEVNGTFPAGAELAVDHIAPADY